MANPQTVFKNLLRQHNFTLVSQNKHYKYSDGKGRILVVAKTPSDHFAYNSMIRDLKAVVSNPPPSSLTIEEERQRRELEKNVVLWAERKKNISAKKCNGKGGGHGHSKSGSGFCYEQAKDVPFIPEEVKEQARLNKEWDNLLYHCKKQTRKVENELEHIFRVIHPMCLSKTAREQIALMLRAKRTANQLPANWHEVETRQQRLDLGRWIAERMAKGTCGEPGEQCLDILINRMFHADATVHVEVNTPEEFGQQFQERTIETWTGALYLTVLAWSHMDSRNPSWLEPIAALFRQEGLTDRGRRLINRAQRMVRSGQITDRSVVEIIAAMGKVPNRLSQQQEGERELFGSEKATAD